MEINIDNRSILVYIFELLSISFSYLHGKHYNNKNISNSPKILYDTHKFSMWWSSDTVCMIM